jgi:uncharacterized DUF497 family protein
MWFEKLRRTSHPSEQKQQQLRRLYTKGNYNNILCDYYYYSNRGPRIRVISVGTIFFS